MAKDKPVQRYGTTPGDNPEKYIYFPLPEDIDERILVEMLDIMAANKAKPDGGPFDKSKADAVQAILFLSAHGGWNLDLDKAEVLKQAKSGNAGAGYVHVINWIHGVWQHYYVEVTSPNAWPSSY